MFIPTVIAALVGYALLHAYLYRKLTQAFAPGRTLRLVLSLACWVLISLPIISGGLDEGGWILASKIVRVPAFIWAAWLFWFVTLGVACDLWNLVVRAAPWMARLRIPPRQQLTGLVLAIAAMTVWSLHEAATPRLVTIPLHHPHYHAGTVTHLVQISDVHLGMLRTASWNRKICALVESLKPDILVSTGDFVDMSVADIGPLADEWARLRPPLGKFAIYGNHEYFRGLESSRGLHQRAGFRLLRQESVLPTPFLLIAGVDDKAGRYSRDLCLDDETTLNNPPDAACFAILLKHQPLLDPATACRFDLQLSGHTHNGQLFPFGVLVRIWYPVLHGLCEPLCGCRLYVHSGTGTWGPPMRLFAPPEIVLFEISGPDGGVTL